MLRVKHLRVVVLTDKRKVTPSAFLRAAQTKRRFDFFHRIRATVIVIAQLLSFLNLSSGVEMNFVFTVDDGENDLHVWFARVRHSRGKIVVVHCVAKE